MNTVQSLSLLLLLLPVRTISLAGFGKKHQIHKKKKQKRSGGGGFGKPTASNLSSAVSSPSKQRIHLGPDKSVSIWVPPNTLEDNPTTSLHATTTATTTTDRSKLLQDYAHYRGTGDVLWPASWQLARLIANCPSFVSGKRCLELGCGLGLVSLAAMLGRPSSLLLCDKDPAVLELACKSCQEQKKEKNNRENNNGPDTMALDCRPLDWSSPPSTTWWPAAASVDMVLAADVLYDAEAARDIPKLLAHLLLPSLCKNRRRSNDDDDSTNDEEASVARALIVDPCNRPHRDAFVAHAEKHGLEASVVPFPGQTANDFVLINVNPAESSKRFGR